MTGAMTGMTIVRALLLAAAALGILSLPLWPAIREALWPSDEQPLVISRYQLQDPRGNARQVIWRYCLRFGLGSPGELGDWLRRQPPGELAEGMHHLGPDGRLPADFGGTDALAAGPLRVPAGRRSGARLFSSASVEIGEGAESFEAHTPGLLELGPGARILWWGSGAEIRLGRAAQALGALRAEREIVAEPGARFHCLRAPLIRALGGDFPIGDEASDIPLRVSRPRQRLVIEHEHELAPGAVLESDLIVRGDLKVGAGARILGSVKAYGTIELAEAAWIGGSVVAHEGVRLGRSARVEGCVLGERWISLEPFARVGLADHPASVSSETVSLAAGARVHGMIRAWKGGYVAES